MTGPRAVRRWVDASGTDGRRGRRAGRRLFRAAAKGAPAARDGVAAIARTSGHRLSERAALDVAVWWAETLSARLRRTVIETGAVAEAPARLRDLALRGRMDRWRAAEAGWASVLLADDDPKVRERTAEICRNATWVMHRTLWKADLGPGTPLREALLDNGTPPPARELNALWRAWIADPAQNLGDALLRWRRQATDADLGPLTVAAVGAEPDVLLGPRNRRALIDALDRDGHPIREIAAGKIAALGDQGVIDDVCARALNRPDLFPLCRKHGFAPRDPVSRATFFLLTGQPRQYRAVDPDGGLLALAYASGTKAERARIREALPAAGELDLVRVIIGDDRRARIASMPEGEVRYLAERLAERREWDDLWAFVQDLPVAAGAALVRLFGTWAPRGEDARRLFGLYREADPAALDLGARYVRESLPSAVRRARLLFHGRVDDVSFAPDGPFLAAGTKSAVGVFDLRTAGLVQRYDGFGAAVGRVLHIGDGAVIACEQPGGDGNARVVRCADARVETVHSGPGAVASLALTGPTGRFAAGTGDGRLLLGGPGGGVEHHPLPGSGGSGPRTVAAHRPSGRVAVLGDDLHVFEPHTGWTAGADLDGPVTQLAFVDADTLVCATPDGAITLLRQRDSRFVRTERAQVSGLARLAVLPSNGDPVVLAELGFLYFLDAASLLIRGASTLDGIDPEAPSSADVHGPARRAAPTSLTVSPDGDFLAVGDAAGHTDLYDVRTRELPGLLARPLAGLVPRHLDIVAAALAAPVVSREALLLLRLLEACLEHRFRFDIQLGDAVRLAAGEHDISL